MLAPNKQNLLLLKGQKKTVENGTKLLKEKQAGLILTFLEMARLGKEVEKKVHHKLAAVMSAYQSSLAFISSQSIIDFLNKTPSSKLEVSKKRISGVYVDTLEFRVRPNSNNHLKPGIANSLKHFAHFIPNILELSQLKLNCSRIAYEIGKTNRQIANLERKIEDIQAQIKFITNTLNEKANLEKATLIKITAKK